MTHFSVTSVICVFALVVLPLARGFIPLKEGNIRHVNKTVDNLNTGGYKLQKTPKQSAHATWSTQWKDYPGGVEHIEFYFGPIKSTYSEVFWKSLPDIQLPPELVKRFDDKGVAVVGVEADQVRRLPNEDISVPINIAYNHHYGGQLLGKGSRMERVKRDSRRPETMHPGEEPGWVKLPVEHTPSKSGLPTSLAWGYSNGGEFRKTYKGLLPPFAQVVDSPTHLSFTPMQIDTWNRDEMNLTGSPFVPGPAPKNSLAPTSGPDAIYSGLLECPRTTRIRKHITGGGWNDSVAPEIYNCTPPTAGQTRCKIALDNAADCFEHAKQLPSLQGLNIATAAVSASSVPPGCTVSRVNNTHASVTFNDNNDSNVCCGSGISDIIGSASFMKSGGADLTLSVSSANAQEPQVQMTLSGPAGVWFGVGFDATSMANAPYAIIVDGKGQVSERVMGNHLPGVEISNSLSIISSKVSNGVRTVQLTRGLKGITPQHHTFHAKQLKIDLISAVGSSPALSYHKTKTVGVITLWPTNDENVCLCSIPAAPFGHGTGTLEYLPTGEVIGFPFRCVPSETIFSSRNPTCDIRTYEGGLSTCHHGWHLLDADQEIPWQDQPLEYYMKFRLYFQEFKAHTVARDITWSIGGDTGEYDVPRCKPGTPTKDCIHEIEGTIVPGGTDLHFVAAHYHCHAPTCLSLEIWNNKTGELICKETPYHGKGNKADKFDEAGYIAQRICLWGDREGFEKPPLVSGVPLYVKATTNSTYGHHGEMALPQMLLASLPVS
jgi:hypothetical protein|eukprot:g6781.t1